jgi:23S rRNA (uracil1939-C5)-methyltransferase
VGRKRKHPLIEKLEIIDIAAEGKAIGKYNNQVVFVPWLAPGDVADVQVVRKKKKFMEARVEKIHEHSSLRQHPFCKHFTICGGCKWQHLPYGHQLKFKQKQVVDNLTRIGKVELKNISKIKPSLKEKYYRNKLEFTFSATRWLTDDEVEKKKILLTEMLWVFTFLAGSIVFSILRNVIYRMIYRTKFGLLYANLP